MNYREADSIHMNNHIAKLKLLLSDAEYWYQQRSVLDHPRGRIVQYLWGS